jgi:arylsulfatase A-like enzyme
MDQDQPQQPNILLLVADDLGWNDVGYHGSQIQTPNIDEIGASGATLEQFYVMPSCSPTRASLLTGRYTMRYGMQVSVIKPTHRYGLPLTEKLLSQSLKEMGYQTAIVGKWHLGCFEKEYLPSERGFDQQYGCYNGMIDYVRHNMGFNMDWDTELVDPELIEEPSEDTVGHDWNVQEMVNYEKGYATDLIRDEAIRILKERNRDKPLFLYVPFTAPHTPLQAKDLDLAPYDEMEMDVPAIFRDESPDNHALRVKRRRFYAALVSNMDAAIGKILSAVKEESMEKDTLIVFVSDNGGSYQGGNNDPLRGQKATVYDGGVRVPAALSFKGRIPEGLIVNTPLHAVDLYPTLLNLAGSTLQQENPLDGREAWRVICGEEEWSNREILIHGRRNRSCAIRIGDWKLVRDGKLGPTNTLKDKESVNELFNLKEDPSEKKNLVADHPEIFSQLSKRLDALIAEEVPALYDLHPMVEEPTPSVWKPRWWE